MKYVTDYGYEIKPVYGPADVHGVEYERDLGDPGNFPSPAGITNTVTASACGHGG